LNSSSAIFSLPIADLSLFNRSAYPIGPRHLHQSPIGIDHVIVNGVGLMENGEHTGAFPGQIVRGAAYQGPRA